MNRMEDQKIKESKQLLDKEQGIAGDRNKQVVFKIVRNSLTASAK